jgi:flagellar hook-length control protein FliK
MSIGSNLNLALISNDFAISSTASAAGNAGKAVPDLMGETPFQKLIAKAMEKDSPSSVTQNATQTEASADTTGMTAQNAESVGDMVAALRYGNAGQAKMKLQTQGDDSTAETVLDTLTQDDTDEDDPTADSLASLLAMFDGAFSAKLITTGDDTETTETELTAADLASLLQSVQPGKSGISGLLNSRAQLAALGENNGQSDKTGAVKLLMYATDESGKLLTVTAEIGGKQIQFTGNLNSSDAATGSTATTTAAKTSADSAVTGATSTGTTSTDQGITLEELSDILKHTGEKASAPGLGQLDSEQIKMRPDHQKTDALNHGKDNPAESGATTDAAATDALEETTTLTGSSNSESDSTEESLTAAAYQAQLSAAATTGTTSATETSKQTGSTEAYSQVSDQILTTLEKKGPTEFKMQLQPENLGQIDISLKISEGKLIIDIAADRTQTQALLTGQVDKLISSLGLQNVQVESVQVTQQMNSDSQNSQNQSYQQQNSGMNFSNSRQNSGETGQSWQQFTGGIFGSQSDLTTNDVLEASTLTASNFGRMNYKI